MRGSDGSDLGAHPGFGTEFVDGGVAGVGEGVFPSGEGVFEAVAMADDVVHGDGGLTGVAGVVIGQEVEGLQEAGFVAEGAEFDEVFVGAGEFGVDGFRERRGGPLGEREVFAAEGGFEFGDALAGGGLHGDDGDAEALTEGRGVNGLLALGDDVDHVEDEDGGETKFEDLGDEVEVALEVGGVDDADDAVGARGAGLAAEEDVAEDGFVRGAGVEGVGAGEVDEAEFFAVLGEALADFFFDGDAGVVGDFLAEAGEEVEDGGFAGVWVTDDGDAWGGDLGGGGGDRVGGGVGTEI